MFSCKFEIYLFNNLITYLGPSAADFSRFARVDNLPCLGVANFDFTPTDDASDGRQISDCLPSRSDYRRRFSQTVTCWRNNLVNMMDSMAISIKNPILIDGENIPNYL